MAHVANTKTLCPDQTWLLSVEYQQDLCHGHYLLILLLCHEGYHNPRMHPILASPS